MICIECKIDKDDSQFYKDLTRTECKKCSRRKYYHDNKEKTNKKRRDKYQDNKEEILKKGREYSKNNKEKIGENKKIYYANNKENISNNGKIRYKKKKEKMSVDPEFNKEMKEKSKENLNRWRKENKDEINKSIRDKKKIDPLYKLKDSIRTLIYVSIKRVKGCKNQRTNDILGCTVDEFKIHIESQFIEGMTWKNHGEWHLDHKIPVSWGETQEKIIELNHYTNFQPLWAFENLSKGNKWSD